MNALAFDRIQIDGKGRGQRFALASLHLGDLALMQHQAADQLRIERALADGAFGRFAHRGEGVIQHIIQALALLDAAAQPVGSSLELVIRKSLERRFECGYRLYTCAH